MLNVYTVPRTTQVILTVIIIKMIRIHLRHRTRSIVVNSDVFDEYRKFEKHITFFGITVWKRDLIHNIEYTKVSPSDVNPIGFKKRQDNEETKEK